MEFRSGWYQQKTMQVPLANSEYLQLLSNLLLNEWYNAWRVAYVVSCTQTDLEYLLAIEMNLVVD